MYETMDAWENRMDEGLHLGKIESFGHSYESDAMVFKVPDYNPISQEHFWISIVAFRVQPDKWTKEDKIIMDQENLVFAGAVGCYYCEQPYKPILLHRRCPGEPRS